MLRYVILIGMSWGIDFLYHLQEHMRASRSFGVVEIRDDVYYYLCDAGESKS